MARSADSCNSGAPHLVPGHSPGQGGVPVFTQLCEQLSIDVPIFAFSHCRDVVAAVTNAGGFGVLGAVAHSPAGLETDLTWIDEQTGGKPHGVVLLLPAQVGDVGPDGASQVGGNQGAADPPI